MTFYHISDKYQTPFSVPLGKDYEPKRMPTPTEQPLPPRQSFDLFSSQRLDKLPWNTTKKEETNLLAEWVYKFCMGKTGELKRKFLE